MFSQVLLQGVWSYHQKHTTHKKKSYRYIVHAVIQTAVAAENY